MRTWAPRARWRGLAGGAGAGLGWFARVKGDWGSARMGKEGRPGRVGRKGALARRRPCEGQGAVRGAEHQFGKQGAAGWRPTPPGGIPCYRVRTCAGKGRSRANQLHAGGPRAPARVRRVPTRAARLTL